eukprot:5167-Heterococcus_DN1.PRE.1
MPQLTQACEHYHSLKSKAYAVKADASADTAMQYIESVRCPQLSTCTYTQDVYLHRCHPDCAVAACLAVAVVATAATAD